MLKWLLGGNDGNANQTATAAANGNGHGGANGKAARPQVLEINADTITGAVLDQMSTTPNPRLKEIMAAAVRHLHAFAREVRLTPGEWLQGIDFITRIGQISSPARQEVILLSDTVGLSALVNMMHDKTALEVATDTSLLGPFFRQNTPRFEAGEQITKKTPAGELVVHGRVTDIAGKPLANAEVCIWQTASDGLYDIQSAPDGEMDSRGIFTTDAQGNYLIRTVAPLDYSIPMDGPVGELVRNQKRHGMRPAHMHFLISAPGFRELVTALYMSDSKYLVTDAVFGSTSSNLVAWIEPVDAACPIKGMPSVKYDFQLSRMSDADRLSGRVGADPAQVGAH